MQDQDKEFKVRAKVTFWIENTIFEESQEDAEAAFVKTKAEDLYQRGEVIASDVTEIEACEVRVT